MQQDKTWWDHIQRQGFFLIGSFLVLAFLGCASLTTSEPDSTSLDSPSPFTGGTHSESS